MNKHPESIPISQSGASDYRNLNKKYNKVELLQLEEDLKKNLTVTKIATKQKPDVVVADHHTMTELIDNNAPSKNMSTSPA